MHPKMNSKKRIMLMLSKDKDKERTLKVARKREDNHRERILNKIMKFLIRNSEPQDSEYIYAKC